MGLFAKKKKEPKKETKEQEKQQSHPQNMDQYFRMRSNEFIKIAKTDFNMVFHMNPSEFEMLDKFILDNWHKNPERYIGAIINQAGSFVGETFRKKHGGCWVKNETIGWGFDIGNTGLIVNPIGKVRKLIENGSEDNIAFFYRAILHNIKEQGK